MFDKLITKAKELLARMGIIKDIAKITDHPEIMNHGKMFEAIEKWKGLYAGYHKDFHDYQVTTLEGVQDRTRNTLNIPKVAASEMASLIYNEKCKISIDNKEVDKLITEVFKNNKFDKSFQDHLEYAFAKGGMVIKPYIEGVNSGRPKIMLAFVDADAFIPVSWNNGNIYEALFPNEFVENKKHYTHLEWHLWIDGIYTVRNELYQSESQYELGRKVPLSQSKKTETLQPEQPIAAIERSLFIYIKPNTANNIDSKSPLGISIFANALDTLRTIDTAFDSLNREFRLGKKRIIVPPQFIKVVIDPKTGQRTKYFDPTDDTYESLGGDMGSQEGIKDISTELRVDEHIAGINALLNIFSMQSGFSTGTFTFDGQSMKTATEVISENSKTFKSKKSHETIIEAGLQELIGSIVVLAKLYKIGTYNNKFEVTVTFDDSIAEDKTTEIQYQSQMVMARIQSRKRAIMQIQGVTDKEADEILAEIERENAGPAVSEERQQSVLLGGME